MSSIRVMTLVAASVLAASFTPPAVAAKPASPVRVYVQEVARPGGAITYRYRVVNGSRAEITTLLIGYSFASGDPQLGVPTGWERHTVPASGSRSPRGWTFDIFRTAEESLFNLEWVIDRKAPGIRGRTTRQGFEVTLPKPDARYASGKWVVLLGSGRQTHFEGNLIPQAQALAAVRTR